MRKSLFILASTASLMMIDPARPQYVPYPAVSGYTMAPAPPQYGPPTPGGVTPGYNWREQRANEDWRNNTWREQPANNNLRNDTWREQRANEDWRQREDYAKDRTPNNAIDRGYVECGVGSTGSSMPCRDNAKDKTKNNAIDRGYVECAAGSVVETCRTRNDSRSSPLPAPDKQAHSPETGGEKKQ
jgi:hypothetical protein